MNDDLGALLEEARALRMSMSPNNSNATITVQAGGPASAIAFAVALLAIVSSIMQGQRISDLRADLQAERARADAHAAWAREEAQIIRGYIWTGKVPALNPYPKQEPKP